MGFWKRKEPPAQAAGAASAQLRDASRVLKVKAAEED